MKSHNDDYKAGSLTLAGTVAMGTGVMIGAGIFALTGQVAELSGPLFPLAFFIAAIISGFSAYTYIKVSNKYPSAGGIAMILKKSYGPTTVTGRCCAHDGIFDDHQRKLGCTNIRDIYSTIVRYWARFRSCTGAGNRTDFFLHSS